MVKPHHAVVVHPAEVEPATLGFGDPCSTE